jgi:hypothetical protein
VADTDKYTDNNYGSSGDYNDIINSIFKDSGVNLVI